MRGSPADARRAIAPAPDTSRRPAACCMLLRSIVARVVGTAMLYGRIKSPAISDSSVGSTWRDAIACHVVSREWSMRRSKCWSTRSWAARSFALAILVLTPLPSQAQTAAEPPPAANQQLLKNEELEALVAPIALYPDTLLAEILMASTYPLEVVNAERWMRDNKNLKNDALKAAV